MTWLEVQITTTPEAEEAVVELFYGSGAKGVVIESADNLALIEKDPTVNYIDESILNMDPDISVIRGYFPQNDAFDEAMHQLISGIKRLPACGLNPGGCELSINQMKEEDWANSWKQFYKPTKVGKTVVVKPTWEDYTPGDDEIIVNMDPGMAFGTGTHETTRLCVMALEKYVRAKDRVIDVGCGLGILSIVAAELGAESVVGVDFDPVAVDAARANVSLNAMDDAVDIRLGDLLATVPPENQADIIVANIFAEVVVKLVDQIGPYLKPEGMFIASGIIEDRLEMVLAKLRDTGYEVQNIEKLGEWLAVSAKRK